MGIKIDVEGFYSQIDENIIDIDKKLSLLHGDVALSEERKKIQDECLNLLTGNKKIFDLLVRELNSQIASISNLILTDDVLDITKRLDDLFSGINHLLEKTSVMLKSLDDSRCDFKNDAIKMYPSQMNIELKNLRENVRKLIQSQIDRYNERVGLINEKIGKLRKANIAGVSELETLAPCRVTITDYRQIACLKQLDYRRMDEVNSKIAELQSKGIKLQTNSLEDELRDEVDYLTTRINEFYKKLNISDFKDRKAIYSQFIVFKSVWLIPFQMKVDDCENKISDDLYKYLLSQMKVIDGNLKIIDSRLTGNKVFTYDEIKEKVDMLYDDISMYIRTVDGLCISNPSQKAVDRFNKGMDEYLLKINDLYDLIREFNFYEKTQRTSLEIKLRRLEEFIKNAKGSFKKVNNTVDTTKEEVKSQVTIGKVSGIDSVEKEIKELDKIINSSKGIIRGKFSREKIQRRIDKVYDEIELLRKDYKNNRAYFRRIYVAKRKLDMLSINYRKRCPLGIRQVKSAKDIYKKNNKLILISSGLAISVLSFMNVGHVLIPAIVFGNLVLSSKYPVLDKFNDILGNVVRAKKKKDDTWVLANGMEINATSAITSLLKGLANCEKLSFVGDTVKKIKELSSKIALKERFIKLKNNFQGDVDDLRLANLYRKFLDSSLEMDKFCEANRLTREQQKKFVAYVNYKENLVERNISHGR